MVGISTIARHLVSEFHERSLLTALAYEDEESK